MTAVAKLREALDKIESLGFPQRFEAPVSEALAAIRAALAKARRWLT